MQRPVSSAPSWLAPRARISPRERCLTPWPGLSPPWGLPASHLLLRTCTAALLLYVVSDSFIHVCPSHQPGGRVHPGPFLLYAVCTALENCQAWTRVSVNTERKERNISEFGKEDGHSCCAEGCGDCG